ncbi:MAG: class I SAM-dependent methyltransferase [Actinomycetota bacterium]|nr:class I SAM-dependent methyltransferase [Actinomycetota bacterium]
MDHEDHVRLISKGVKARGGTWADFGSGEGAFTLALAELLLPSAELHSIERDPYALHVQKSRLKDRFPNTRVVFHLDDFTRPLDLPPLDGAVMANSLHFYRSKEPVVSLITSYLKPGGSFVLVEYDADRGNPWVPYPISFKTWQLVAHEAGLVDTSLLEVAPSRFLGRIFAAASMRPREG